MEKEIQELIISIYQEIMDETEDVDLEGELEWDSFDKMRFVLRMEEETGRSLDDVLLEVVKATTLKEVIESIVHTMN